MPLDGLSFSNLAINRIITPIEAAAQAEHSAQLQAETSIKKPDEMKNVKADIDNSKKDQHRDLQGRDTEDEEEESQDEETSGSILENHAKIKKYRVKFNQITDMVELVDQTTGFVIETISPDDLISLISKSKGSSGILVDREV